LAVWSENALPALLPENAHLLRGALPEHRGPRALLLGAGRADPARPGTLHTSAFLADESTRLLAVHDKVRLLPFAERAPWPLSASRLGIVPIAPGTDPVVMEWRGTRFGPLLCYEVLFAGLVRDLARDGAGILVNLSNDSWFGASGAAEQHLAAAMFRAIETRRPLLRATHTGISAGLDASGRVVATLPRDVPGTLRLDVAPGAGTTLYTALGDAPLSLLAAAILAAQGLRRRASSARPSPSNAAVRGSGTVEITVSSNMSASRPKSWPRNTTRTMPSGRSMPRKLSIH
jgi:apolipoprotein N-acyltransferase